MANSGTITEYRGIRGLVGALLTTDTAAELAYGTPFFIAGTSELTKETESSSEAHYYDGIPAVVIDSVGADTVNVNVSAVPLEIVSKITGQYYDATTGTLVEDNSPAPYMAIGYITEDTDGKEIYVWRHKGKFARPGSTHATKDNGTGANGQSLVFTGINTTHKFTTTGKSASALVTTAETCGKTEDQFFAGVMTVDDIVSGNACLVTFSKTPANAVVVVKDSESNFVAALPNGKYSLAAGSYTYSATADGYTAITDSAVTISSSDVTTGTKTITVTLTETP